MIQTLVREKTILPFIELTLSPITLVPLNAEMNKKKHKKSQLGPH